MFVVLRPRFFTMFLLATNIEFVWLSVDGRKSRPVPHGSSSKDTFLEVKCFFFTFPN